MDFLGVAIYGSTTPESKIVTDFVLSMGGKEESTIIGHKSKVPCISAALANGVSGHVIELDDVHTTAIFHPGITIIPAALSLGERQKCNGKKLITAIALGYDIGINLGIAINPSHRFRGFHTTGTCGALAAVATAGKILQLKRSEMKNAFGLAATQASGLLEMTAMGKRLNPGKAAQTGVISALLAQEGFTSTAKINGNEMGFCKAFSDDCKFDGLEKKLGMNFMILETDVKIHACCAMFHSALDALLDITRNEVIDIQKIRRVIVRTYRAALDGHSEQEPKSRVAATMSFPYSLAAALVRGQAGVEEFNDDSIRNKEILRLAKAVELVLDTNLDKSFPNEWPAHVLIEMEDGNEFDSYVEKPKGFYPDKPLNDNEFERKFISLASGKLQHKLDDIISSVWQLEDLADVNDLTALLST